MKTKEMSSKLAKARETCLVESKPRFTCRIANDWLRGWLKFCGPIKERHRAKLNESYRGQVIIQNCGAVPVAVTRNLV